MRYKSLFGADIHDQRQIRMNQIYTTIAYYLLVDSS